MLIAATFATSALAEAPRVEKVEPPNWWAGHTINPVRLLVRGTCLHGARITPTTSGIHGGDLRGIIERLPYLKELGVTALWLNPWCDNWNGIEGEGERRTTYYHGYHAIDYYAVEDRFGDLGYTTVQNRNEKSRAALGGGQAGGE